MVRKKTILKIIRNRECSNLVFFTASRLPYQLSVYAFEFRSIDSRRRKLIGLKSWLCLSRYLIGGGRWKKLRHFLRMKTIPFFKAKQTAVVGCLHEKPQAMSSSRRPRLCTEYYRKAKSSSSNTRRSNLSKSEFLPRDRPVFSNDNVCFRASVCNGRF